MWTPAADGQQPPPGVQWDYHMHVGLGGITGGGQGRQKSWKKSRNATGFEMRAGTGDPWCERKEWMHPVPAQEHLYEGCVS